MRTFLFLLRLVLTFAVIFAVWIVCRSTDWTTIAFGVFAVVASSFALLVLVREETAMANADGSSTPASTDPGSAGGHRP